MNPVLSSLIYVFVSCIMLFISKVLFDIIAPFKVNEQVKEKNTTPIIAFCGYWVGITFVLIGAFAGPSNQVFKIDLLMYVLYALLGIVLVNLSGFITDKIMLNRFSTAKEMLEDKNIGTAAVHAGFYLATGLIVAACVNGEYGGLLSSIIYYLAGMVFLFIFIKIYDLITPSSIHEELEKDNYSVGIALAGNVVAIGLILMKATLGDVSDWHRGLVLYFVDLASIILLLPAVRLILGNVIVKNINKAIKENNVAAGLIEFIGIICFALIIFFMVDFSALV